MGKQLGKALTKFVGLVCHTILTRGGGRGKGRLPLLHTTLEGQRSPYTLSPDTVRVSELFGGVVLSNTTIDFSSTPIEVVTASSLLFNEIHGSC